MTNPKKELLEPEQVVRSLIALREELSNFYKNHTLTVPTSEMLSKIDQCLYETKRR